MSRAGKTKRDGPGARMIDNFALGLTHVLMMIAAIILLRRPDLDHEPGPRDKPPANKPRGKSHRDA